LDNPVLLMLIKKRVVSQQKELLSNGYMYAVPPVYLNTKVEFENRQYMHTGTHL